jgi:hypothetical protein
MPRISAAEKGERLVCLVPLLLSHLWYVVTQGRVWDALSHPHPACCRITFCSLSRGFYLLPAW